MPSLEAYPSLLRLRNEWSGNQRLRAASWTALAILGLYLFLVLLDWRQGLHEEYGRESVRLYKTAAMTGQDTWLARAQQARDLRKALDAQVPVAATLGLAQAEAQSWVQQLLRAYGRDLSSEARAPVQIDPAAHIWRIPINVRGSMTPGQYVEMLRRIEGNERLIVIDQVTIDNQRRPTVDMVITAHYRVPPAAAASAGATNAAR